MVARFCHGLFLTCNLYLLLSIVIVDPQVIMHCRVGGAINRSEPV